VVPAIADSPGRRSARAARRQVSAAIPVLNSVLVAPVTRTIRDIPTELRLGTSDGMPIECVASFDNLRVVAKAYLVERQSTLDPLRLAEASEALRSAVDC
jgi:mRNA interferase MazF